MSATAGQPNDGTLPTVLGEVNSIDGVPFGKPLTKKGLKDAAEALEKFIEVVRLTPAEKKAALKVAEKKAAERKAAETKAAERKEAEEKTARRSTGHQSTEDEAAEKKAAKKRLAAEKRAAEKRAAEKKAAEKKAAESGAHCLVVAGGLGFLNADRTESTDDEVRDCCYRHFGYYPEEPLETTVHVIVDSLGGSLDSAFKAMLILRRFATDIRVYVPRRAKSAATLMTLGADEIFMSPFAELGPLDTQIKDPRNPTTNISALDCYQSVDYVQKFALDTLPKFLTVLLRETDARVPLSDLVTTATRFTLKEVTPILEQVRALDFGGWGRTLKIGETYARALQQRQGYVRDKKADEIAKKLVYGYPHHPYYIDADEARKIGLTIQGMTKEQYEPSLRIAQACDESRCVGFIEDLWKKEEQLPAGESVSMDGNGSVPRADVALGVVYPGRRW